MEEKNLNLGNNQDVSEEDIENVLNILENFGDSQEGRLKVSVSDEIEQATAKKSTYYGRCDVGQGGCK